MLFLTVGLNYGIDFIGGTLIEVRITTGPADLADDAAKARRAASRRADVAGMFGSRCRHADAC